jgi:selenide,water dikinase
VLLGGGHAHVEVLRLLALQPVADCEIALVSPYDQLLYSGMVPGYVAGHYALEDCVISLTLLAQRSGARFHRTHAALVDPSRREVTLADGGALAYDVLSIDIGSRTSTGDAKGVDRHAFLLRPLEEALQAWSRVHARVAEGGVRSITLVGGGAAGVELAFAMHHRLGVGFGERAPHVRIVTDAAEPLPELAAGARSRAARILAERGIGLHCGHRVREVGPESVRLEGGNEFASDATFWSAGAAAPDLVRDSGFATDERGFLLSNAKLQSVSHPEVFAAGDCATQQGIDRPRAGVFAVRAGPALAANLRAALSGAPLAPHVSGKRYLALMSTGAPHAIGAWNGLAFEGAWAWRWKDRIDRTFIARYR